MQISEAFERIAHILGNPDGAVAIGNLRVLNDAGRHFYSMRTWRFARRSSTRVTIPAGSSYLTLPLGCAQIIDLCGTASWGGCAQRVDQARFAAIRATEIDGAGGMLYWCDVFDMTERRLEIFPTQDETTVNGLVLTYRADWQRITNAIDTTATLPIPEFAEPLFGRVLECFALGMARPESGTVDQHLAGIGPVFETAAEADSRSVLDYGPARNTALEVAARRTRDNLTWDMGTVRLPIL